MIDPRGVDAVHLGVFGFRNQNGGRSPRRIPVSTFTDLPVDSTTTRAARSDASAGSTSRRSSSGQIASSRSGTLRPKAYSQAAIHAAEWAVRPSRSVLPGDDNGYVGGLCDRRAHRSQQHAGESTTAMTTDDDELR